MNLSKSQPHFFYSILSLIGFNCCLIAFRFLVTGGIGYGFLIWNLFLALVPLLISWKLVKQDASKMKVFAFSAIWLLFFPNAPYILTDFLHFRHLSHSMPAWFDLLLLASFSISGLLFGLLSMRQMHSIWERKFGSIGNYLIAGSALVSGFGIYLGRFERYNSWDILSDPIKIVFDSVSLMTELRAIGFTWGYGTLLLVVYYFFFFGINSKITSNQ